MKPFALLFALVVALSTAASNTSPAHASARAWVSYIRIVGDRSGQAGWHHAISRGVSQTVGIPTASPKITSIVTIAKPTPSPKINPAVVTIANPSASPAGGPITQSCNTIVLVFAPLGGYGVAGTYEPDSAGGCLFAIPLHLNAAQTGHIGWHTAPEPGLGGGGTGKASFGNLKGPGPLVTLRPDETINVEIGYDPYTNTFLIWPR